MKRMEKNQFRVVKGHVDDEQLWKIQCCLVGESTSFSDTKSMAERNARIDLGEISIKRI